MMTQSKYVAQNVPQGLVLLACSWRDHPRNLRRDALVFVADDNRGARMRGHLGTLYQRAAIKLAVDFQHQNTPAPS